jgi:hypothetical protein
MAVYRATSKGSLSGAPSRSAAMLWIMSGNAVETRSVRVSIAARTLASEMSGISISMDVFVHVANRPDAMDG